MALQIDSCYFGNSIDDFHRKKLSNRDMFSNIPDRIGMTNYHQSRINKDVKFTVSRHIIGHDDYDRRLFINALSLNKQTNKAVKLLDFINSQGYTNIIKDVAKSKVVFFETSSEYCLLLQMVEPCEREYIIVNINKTCVGGI